jgi:hypothetical protein
MRGCRIWIVAVAVVSLLSCLFGCSAAQPAADSDLPESFQDGNLPLTVSAAHRRAIRSIADDEAGHWLPNSMATALSPFEKHREVLLRGGTAVWQSLALSSELSAAEIANLRGWLCQRTEAFRALSSDIENRFIVIVVTRTLICCGVSADQLDADSQLDLREGMQEGRMMRAYWGAPAPTGEPLAPNVLGSLTKEVSWEPPACLPSSSLLPAALTGSVGSWLRVVVDCDFQSARLRLYPEEEYKKWAEQPENPLGEISTQWRFARRVLDGGVLLHTLRLASLLEPSDVDALLDALRAVPYREKEEENRSAITCMVRLLAAAGVDEQRIRRALPQDARVRLEREGDLYTEALLEGIYLREERIGYGQHP